MELSAAPRSIPPIHMDEPIDVLRIRLWNPYNAMAQLSEFYCAERLLASWATCTASSRVGFEVVFVDGHVVEGSYEFFRRGRRRCLLSTHVRRLLCGDERLPRYNL
ncbi:MAG: hypothetical protein ACJ8HI_05135 [Massilia sp.]